MFFINFRFDSRSSVLAILNCIGSDSKLVIPANVVEPKRSMASPRDPIRRVGLDPI